MTQEDKERIEKVYVTIGKKYGSDHLKEIDTYQMDAINEANGSTEKPWFREVLDLELMDQGKIEGFNEGIEAVKELFQPLFKIDPVASNIILIAKTIAKIYGDIEKLKKPI